MKFLDITPLARCPLLFPPTRAPQHLATSSHTCSVSPRLDTFLNSVDVGDYIVHGNLEAYSCGCCPSRTNSSRCSAGNSI
jgi:hypothetical protein